MKTQISHDAFARYTVDRETVETTSTCACCGNKRKSGRLFQYSTQSDGYGARSYNIPGLFCSIGCMREYHN